MNQFIKSFNQSNHFNQFMNHLRHQKYKNKRLNNTLVLKVKNGTLELNNFIPINISINDMDKFEKKNWFININERAKIYF